MGLITKYLNLQGYLAHEKMPPPKTLQRLEPYGGPRGGGGFLWARYPCVPPGGLRIVQEPQTWRSRAPICRERLSSQISRGKLTFNKKFVVHRVEEANISP